jgi:hypothetical protein
LSSRLQSSSTWPTSSFQSVFANSGQIAFMPPRASSADAIASTLPCSSVASRIALIVSGW